jgi:hypothetical protein
MNVDNMTIGELKQITQLLSSSANKPAMAEHPYKIGQTYLIRTVTHYFTGKLVEIYEHEFVLENSAWIADTGRFSDALKTGVLNEIEPIPGRHIVMRGPGVDCSEWNHKLPDKQK